MNNSLKKTLKLACVFLTAAAVAAGTAAGAREMYRFGYGKGLPTGPAAKSGLRQILCFHDWEEGSGVCSRCGLVCPHPVFGEDSVCEVCGYLHRHTWDENGVCTECGARCTHENWRGGVCRECGYVCLHPEWKDDVCMTCGMHCLHTEFRDGKCVRCGISCPHENWENGVCTACGKVCTHEEHSCSDGICTVCGTKVCHDYSGGVCSCGKTPPFLTEAVPDGILAGSERKGTVLTVTYQTKRYASDGEEMTKNMDVYLPYGYDASEKYNVLLILHDDGGNYTSWSTEPVTVGTSMTSPRNLYDSMMDEMLCRPLILVSLTTNRYTEEGPTDSGTLQMASEIRNDILPCIAENFSTYASGSSTEALSGARAHFGIMGFGEGAVYALECGIAENLDLFSNFFCLGGGYGGSRYAEAAAPGKEGTLPVRLLFCGAGASDPARKGACDVYRAFAFPEGNEPADAGFWYLETSGGAGICEDFTLLYDALLVAFPEVRNE